MNKFNSPSITGQCTDKYARQVHAIPTKYC